MRLRLSIQRHGLPTVKLLWRVPEDCTTVAKLLEQVSEAVPLDSDTWDVEDYVVEVRGYECLHYQVVSEVLKEEDKVRIRPLDTADIRARTVSGRYQITPAGAKLTDGIAYGRSRIKQICRPRVRIPPRKRQRLIATESDGDSDGDSEDEPRWSSSQQLRIESGNPYNHDATGEVKENSSISGALGPTKKRKRLDGQERRVSFDKSSISSAQIARFDIYEDEDEDEDDEDDYTPDTDSSSSEESDSESESDAENREPPTRARAQPGVPGKVFTVSPSPSPSSSLVSSASTSSISSDSETSISSEDSLSSDSPDSSDSSEEEAEMVNSKTSSKKIKGKKLTEKAAGVAEKKAEARPVTPSSKTENENKIASKEAKAVQNPPVPPGQGKKSTKSRNERRKRANAQKRLAEQGQSAALVAEPPVNEEAEKNSTAVATRSDASSFEQKRQDLLNALAQGGVDIEADLATGQPTTAASSVVTEQGKSRKNLRTPKAKQSESHETPTFSTPDDVDDLPEFKKPRIRLDLASSRRLLFGSLGVRTPKTKEDEENLREHFMKSAQPAVKKGSKASCGSSLVSPQASAGERGVDDLDAWRCKIDLSAVECVAENVKLSAPPFPFVQRWDPQQQTPSHDGIRGKKRKRKNNYTQAESNTANDVLDYDDVGTAPFEHPTQILDLPKLPKDVSSLKALTFDQVKEGAVIAFKQFEVSQETNWQPGFSMYRTAVVEKLDEVDSLIHLRLAQRDRPSQKAQYDEEGYRIYGKFEVPPQTDSDDEVDDAVIEILFSEMVEPKLVVAAVAVTPPPIGPLLPAADANVTTVSSEALPTATASAPLAAAEQESTQRNMSPTNEPSTSTLAVDPEADQSFQSQASEGLSKKRDRKKLKRRNKKNAADTESRMSTPAAELARASSLLPSFSPSVEPDPRRIPLPDSSSPAISIKAN